MIVHVAQREPPEAGRQRVVAAVVGQVQGALQLDRARRVLEHLGKTNGPPWQGRRYAGCGAVAADEPQIDGLETDLSLLERMVGLNLALSLAIAARLPIARRHHRIEVERIG